jgi:hypothetical protein
MLQELMQDNRAELEDSLSKFLTAGVTVLNDTRARFHGEAEAAQKLANQRDPDVAALTPKVIQARQALSQAEDKVKEIEAQRPDPPRPDTTRTLRPAAIPQIPLAPPGPGLARDAETRSVRQWGRIPELDAARDLARQRHGKATAALSRTEDALQQARKCLKAAQAEHGQAREAAQHELTQLRAEQGEQSTQLKALNTQIEQARDGLRKDPALLGLIAPWALERVIKIHVDPNDDAVCRRALEQTSLNGRYDSLEHMAQAVVDVHEAAKRRFPPLFAARTLQEFEQAAKEYQREYDETSQALVNVPHEHGRLIGLGYDDHADRTDRLLPLTRSEYGLAWRDGRVVISHLHPSVPRRTLTTLA